MKFVVVANPKAARFRDDPGQLDLLYRASSGRGILITPSSPEELERELKMLKIAGLPSMFVAGGDGTMSLFTTSLLRVWKHDRLPELGLIDAGTMNTISRSLGNVPSTPAAQLTALLAGDGVQRTQRWPLQVGEDRWGWLFGTGIIPRYIQAYERGGNTGPKKAALTLRDKVLDAFRGTPEARAFFAPHRCDVVVDGRLLPLKEWLLVTIGGTHDLGLGFRPFPGLLDQPGTMGFFATGSSPVTFATDLPRIRMQWPVKRPLAFQQLAQEVRLTCEKDFLFNLDGEVEVSEPSLTVRSGPPITFQVPKGVKMPANRLGP